MVPNPNDVSSFNSFPLAEQVTWQYVQNLNGTDLLSKMLFYFTNPKFEIKTVVGEVAQNLLMLSLKNLVVEHDKIVKIKFQENSNKGTGKALRDIVMPLLK